MGRVRFLVGTLVVALVALAGGGAASAADKALTATDVGVTPTEIRIGVIADTGSSLAPGLFQGSVDGVQGWAKWRNANGGLAGRKVVVDVYDSALDASKARNSVIDACSKDFALVGTSAIFLSNVNDMLSCPDKGGAATGIPDYPVLTTEIAHQCSTVSFPINPPLLDCATRTQSPQTYNTSNNSAAWLLSKYGKKALHGVYVYPSDLKASHDSWIPQYKARQDLGITSDGSFDVSARAPQSAYTPIVQTMKEKGSTYAIQGGTANVMIALMKEAKLQGVNTVKVWECTLQCYDDTITAAPETEGLYVDLLFLPFDETASNPMLKNFVKYVGKDKANGFAAQAWAAAELFGESVQKVADDKGDDGLTRSALLAATKSFTSFDAGGMMGAIDIAERTPSNCIAITQVRSGKFVRVFPKKKGTFSCEKGNQVAVKVDIPTS